MPAAWKLSRLPVPLLPVSLLRVSLLRVFLVLPLALCGCHSRYIEATVTNTTAGPVSLVEVDYPSASFGRETLAAGAVYHYRFKVLGSGATKVLWTDAAHVEHTMPGPELNEGDEGTLTVSISATTAQWRKNLLAR